MKVPQISLSVVLFLLLFNLVVLLIAHSLQLLVGAVLARYFKGEVGKPAVFFIFLNSSSGTLRCCPKESFLSHHHRIGRNERLLG